MNEATIFFFLIVVGLPIVCGTLLVALLIWRGMGSKSRRANEAEETRLIQEIHHDVTRLEQRIEAIETIVLEHERTRKS